MARARTPKFNQGIYKPIKLKVTENQIGWVIQIDVVKTGTGAEIGTGITSKKTPCYMGDLAYRRFIVKKAKIF